MNWFTLNAGSSTIKYKLFSEKNSQMQALLSGLIEGIAEKNSRWQEQGVKTWTRENHFANHEQAFAALAEHIVQVCGKEPLAGIGHRVVHGGTLYRQPTRIDAKVLANIRALSSLAPLHNPANALGIDCAMQTFPQVEQVAVFDTAFHAKMPAVAAQYAIAPPLRESYHIRRYGFHGINHAYVAKEAAKFLQKPEEDCQWISLHLGNGASACLIKEGYSQDTSMGMTPLCGLIMGSRCGDIDPAIPLFLLEQGETAEKIEQSLNHQSGLKALAGDNDMRRLLARKEQGDLPAQQAIAMYCYAIQKYIGAYYSQCPALDALIFTGGIGENAAPIRELTLQPLAHLGLQVDVSENNASARKGVRNIAKGPIPILVIPAEEEKAIAQATRNLLHIS